LTFPFPLTYNNSPTRRLIVRRRSLRVFWLIFLSGLILIGLLTSCARSPYSLDQRRAVEKTVSAEKGGEIGLKTAKEKIRLAIPQQALNKDATIIATPLTEAPLADQKDVLVKGVLLEEKGKEGKSLNFKFPVLLSFTVKGTLPEEATIVKYLPDKKSYEVIATEVTTKGNETTLTAELMSLSGYGGKKGKPKEIKKAKKKAEDTGIWHIKVLDTVKKKVGEMEVSNTLSFQASNLSGKITGYYYTSFASLKRKGSLQVGPVWSKVDEEFEGVAVIKIITLQKEEEATSFRGEGTLNLAGTGEVETAGPGLEHEISGAGETAVAVDVTINGAVVTIKVVRSHPVLAGLTFKGTLVRGKIR
jgi:hypothetical protein